MAKSSGRRAMRRIVVIACAALAPFPAAFAAAPDPFAPFPVAEGEASDPRIETLRQALRPGVFKPAHEVVITDGMYFRWRGMRDYIRQCGGEPNLTTILPRKDTVASPFKAKFENPQSPIRSYAGDGYACVFPVSFGPYLEGLDLPAVQGLITYADGSYWLGEVKGGGNPPARESASGSVGTALTPTPAGHGEWGRADGTRVQGEARVVSVPLWPKGWNSNSVVGFEMTAIRAASLPDGRMLAGELRLENGNVVVAPSAAPSPAPAIAAAPSAPVAAPAAPPAAVAPAASAAPPVPAGGDPDAAAYAERIEGWRAAMAATDFSSARSSQVWLGLHKPKDYERHVQQCGGGQMGPVKISFEGTGAKITGFTGFAPGCALPAQPTPGLFGLIRYADGSSWLGQVAAMPQAEAVQLSGWGGVPAPVYNLVPSPTGLGEWSRPDGTRLQVVAAPLRAKYFFRENWLQGPLASFEVMSVSQLLTDGGAFTGDLRFANDTVFADNAEGRWADGRRFTGKIANGRPVSGTLAYADGSQLSGRLVVGDDGRTQWEAGVDLSLAVESPAGPAGRYRHYARLPLDAPRPEVLPLQGARPMDAATLARATRNTRQCAQPALVPKGWVTWWPSCEPGAEGRVSLYRPDARQELTQYASGQPARYVLRSGYGDDPVRGVEILASAFDASADPSPQGAAELRLEGQGTVFIGTFAYQMPTSGQCPVPSYEGGGWEPCRLSGYQRVDELHQLRQERLELARQQEELRRQMEEEAEAERYAQRQWEAEQERAELEEQKRRDRIAGQQAILNAIQDGARQIGDAYAQREQARYDYERRQREASRPSYSAPSSSYSSSGGTGGPGSQDYSARMAQLEAQQAELQRRQMALRVQSQASAAPAPQAAGPEPSRPQNVIQDFSPDPARVARDRRCFELSGLIASADIKANECTGTKESGGFETLGAWREHERKCWATARATQEPLKAEQARLCGSSNESGKARQM